MANNVIILGPSGSGKSTSIKGLNPEETVIINILNKRLPFKGSSKMYSAEKKNLFKLDSYSDIINMLNMIDQHATHVKNIIIDDSVYVMRKEFFKRASETGYGKFTQIAQHYQEIITTCENLRPDLNVFLMLHTEDVIDDGAIVSQKVSTVGKMLDTQYNPVEVVTMVLCTSVQYNEKGIAQYGFYTHRTMKGKFEVIAKTPDGMFEQDIIPNDLGLVVDAMNEFYG